MNIEGQLLEQAYAIKGKDDAGLIPDGTERIQISYRGGKPYQMIYIGRDTKNEISEAEVPLSLKETWDILEIGRVLGLIKPKERPETH